MRECGLKIKALFIAALLMVSAYLLLPEFAGIVYAEGGTADKPATILFTHDTHSHVLPARDADGNEYGGYTRLYTLLKHQRMIYSGKSSVITLDGGDFSMGTLFQTIYMTDACELRLLGTMGYDVTTFGNHEYDYREEGLAAMLNAAVSSKSALPQIVTANYRPPEEGEEGYTEASGIVRRALDNYGVKEYTMLERDGVRYAVFGVFGEDADECSPMSGMIWEPAKDAAKRIVAEIKANEQYDYIICLSHSGTDEDKSKSEDYQLAKAVDGIDVIISGHTHSVLEEPLTVNGTIIVSAGEYTRNLGVLRIAKDADGKTKLVEYKLIRVDSSVEEDKVIVHAANKFKTAVTEKYLSDYNMEFDQILAVSGFGFKGISHTQEELPLGSLISDAYIYAVKCAEGSDYVPVDFAVVANGVIRGTFSEGEITVADAFNVSSLGIGADLRPGYPLISVYVKGSELKDLFEVDASVTPIMAAAQLNGSGMTWSFNTRRMIFNKVTGCMQLTEDGQKRAIDEDKYYRVVTGLYSGQMLSAVNGKSYGILTITPCDKDGNPIKNFEDCIIYDGNGNEVKEWYALAAYLDSFEEAGGVSVVPDRYKEAEGRKIVYASLKPSELLRGANWITITVLVVTAVLIGIVVFCIVHHNRSRRHRRPKRY